jgi:hypothetical protein
MKRFCASFDCETWRSVDPKQWKCSSRGNLVGNVYLINGNIKV